MSAPTVEEHGPWAQAVTPLSKTEEEVLRLYDRLQELKLEMALLQSHQAYQQDVSKAHDQDLSVAQNELLQARSSYSLGRTIVDNLLTVTPILKSVHHRNDTSPLELDILPYLRERDFDSVTLSKQSSELRQAWATIIDIQNKTDHISRQNISRTSELFELAESAERRKFGETTDVENEELERLKQEVKDSRQRWKVIKGTVSAVIAGSGIDWVNDPELLDIVLDDVQKP